MFNYHGKELVYIVTSLCLYSYSLFMFMVTTTTTKTIRTHELSLYKNNLSQSHHHVVYYLHESEHFQPCIIEQSDLINSKVKMIICQDENTLQFGNRLPIFIQTDKNYSISTIRIENNPKIEICSSGTFENILMYNNSTRIIERKLILKGLSLHIFQHGCFKGLSQLDVLYIENQYDGDELKKVSGNLFQELKYLHNLKSLHLENIDLSIGIPQYAFHGWINRLTIITMINNNLNRIHNEAFPLNNEENKLLELRIEKQIGDGWKLLDNSYIWAKYLYALKLFSLDGTNLHRTQDTTLSSSSSNIPLIKASLKLHLGDYVNSNLEHLNIQNCGLTNLIDNHENNELYGLNLYHLGGQLKQLYIGFNRFDNFNFLNVIKKFHQLQLLSINSNQIPLEKLPQTFSMYWPYLEELQITSNGINYVPVHSISNNLKVLHLSENPLELFDDNWINLQDQATLNELHLNSIRLISVQLEDGQANWEKILRPIKNSIEHLSLINCQLEANMLIKSMHHEQMNENNQTAQEHINEQVYLNLGLTHLKKLKSLILSGNYLEYIPPGLFENLNELNSLVLTQNQLLTIQEYKIENETEHEYTPNEKEHHLSRLDLSYNLLVTMERCAYALGFKKPFESIIPLKPIWLTEREHHHQVSSNENLNYGLYESNQIYWLGGLNIIGNPFVCDCRLAWFRHFINQMSEQFHKNEQLQKEQSVTIINASFGFQKYLNEAINFTCYGTNQWTGRNFLTLTPLDLYMEEHIDCRIRPDIYGKDMQSLETLKPCWKLNKTQSPNLEEILQIRHEVMLEASIKSTLYGGAPPILPDNGTTISNEAYTLIILAGIAALCFIIISIIIIIWLCIRLKRNTPYYKPTISSSLVQHRKSFNTRLNKVRGSFKNIECYRLPSCGLFTTCANCTNNRRYLQKCSLCGCTSTISHSTHSSNTNEVDHQLTRPKSYRSDGSNETRSSIFFNPVNNVPNFNHQRTTSSIYSEMTNLETQSLNQFMDSNEPDKKFLFKSKTQRKRERKLSNNIELNHGSEYSDDEKKSILQIRKNSQPDILMNSHFRRWNSNRIEKPLQTSASVQTLLQINNNQPAKSLRSPPDSLVPPLPAPRKSKSIGDLQQNTRIESPTHLPTEMMPFHLRRSAKQLAIKKMEERSMHQPAEASINLLRHYDTKKKHSLLSTGSSRHSALPCRDKSLDNNEFASIKPGKSVLTSSRASLKSVFRRTRLIVSARARLENNEKSIISLRNNWLSASRHKIGQSLKWLKRDRTSKTGNSRPQPTQTQHKPRQVHSENDVKFLGPELPKPFFLLPKQEPEYATPFTGPKDIKQHTDYLPMHHDKYTNNESPVLSFNEKPTGSINKQIKTITKKSPVDEYVTDLIHIDQMNYPNMILLNPFNSSSPQQQLPSNVSVKPPTTNTLNNPVKTSANTLPLTITSTNQLTEIDLNNDDDNNNNINNKPVRPPRHQRLHITGDNMYRIQTLSDKKSYDNSKHNSNNNNRNTTNNNTNSASGSELHKPKKSDKYWLIDYELPLPPPPPPPPPLPSTSPSSPSSFMFNNNHNNKSNINEILLLSDIMNKSTHEESDELRNRNNTTNSALMPTNISLTTTSQQSSIKPKRMNVKPLRSVRIPQSTPTTTTTTATMRRNNYLPLNFTAEQNDNNNNNVSINNRNYRLIEKSFTNSTANK